MIERFEAPAAAAAWCRERCADGRSLGLVPTMGALHEGHLALVRRAAEENDAVCASVFVNPLQFDDPRDLAAYPRDFDADAEALDAAGCAMVFTGTLAGFFPETDGAPEPREPGPAAAGLEGEHRAGHFAGVATIVARLFELVRPTRAYFGEKDFQQTLVVRDVARALGGPEVRVCPTVREPGGLARSSRNLRLSAADERRARGLSAALRRAHRAWAAGARDADELAGVLAAGLGEAELDAVEYGEVRDPEAWTAARPEGPLERAQALVAARVGGVRLIDTLRLDAPLPPELEDTDGGGGA